MNANTIRGPGASCHAPPRLVTASLVTPRLVTPASVASTTLLVLLPKCPFCILGWMGALGLSGYASEALMIPSVVLALFCASQVVFFFTGRRTGDLRSLLIAALGVTLVLAGALLELGAALAVAFRIAGVALVVLASVLNAVRMQRAPR